MTSSLSFPLLFGDNRLLPANVGEMLQIPSTILFAIFLGAVVSLLAVFVAMIWKQLKLDGGQYLLWSLIGAVVLSPVIYFAILAPPSGYYLLDILRLSNSSRLELETRKIAGVIYIPIVLFAASFVLGVLLGKWLRLKEMGWKFGLILGSCLAASAIIALGQFKLGVDLQGGVILVYELDVEQSNRLLPPDKQNQWDMNAVAQILKKRLNPDGLKELVIRVSGPKQIEIVVPEVDEAEIAELQRKITVGGALQFMVVADDASLDRNVYERARDQAASKVPTIKLDDRVRAKPTEAGQEGTIIGYWKGVARERDNDDLSPYRDEFVFTGMLRDRASGDIIDLAQDELSLVQANPKENLPKVLAKRGVRNIEVLLRYDPNLKLEGKDLGYSSEGRDEHLRPSINFEMKGEGVSKMGQLTSTYLKRRLAIVFDNNLLSAPTIQGQITDHGTITGNFSVEEVRFMVEILRSGSMPVVLRDQPISKNQIGSLLGQETVTRGSRSIAIALLVVLVFTAVYYRFAGLVACAALVLNIVLTVAIMVMLQAPFTLPGLAGIVLTVGMSVDSNVLIFERIREELAKGAALRMALRNGFDRAMTTIIDSNLTTLLTAVVLYAIGTDQVRGFGITLTLGILTSMFTAIFCARTIFEAGERLKSLKTLTMMKMFTRTNVDWCKWFPAATIGSVILIAIGLVATYFRGEGLFDIDLVGGTSATMVLNEKKSDQVVRDALRKQFDTLGEGEAKGKPDFTVYEIAFAGRDPQTVYKVDSNIVRIETLQAAIQNAFPGGLQTHRLEMGSLKTLSHAAAPPEAEIPGGPSPFEAPTTPGPTPGSKSSPATKEKPATKAEPVKAAPAVETKDTDDKKGGESAPQEKAAAEKSEEKSACGGQDEKNGEEKPTDEATPKAEAPKSETPKTEAPGEEPAKESTVDPPTATKAPSTTPPVSTAPDLESPASTAASDVFHETTADLTFPDNKISGEALKKLLDDVVKKVLRKEPPVGVTRKDTATGRPWDGKDTTAYEDWTVTLPLPEDQARSVLGELKTSLENTPVWQSSNAIQGQVTVDTQLKALTAILFSLVGIVAYVWFRFQNLSWGIAAVAALVHDTLVMLGFIAMSLWLARVFGFLQVEEFKISLTIVAAFLTLIGYSINDTIVIFDRIREIRGKSPDLTRHMINESVNQTMSRTILTTGTVLMTVLVLYFAGGSGIHAFAFSMIVGALAGTYSTVFIAAPLLLWLHNRPKSASGKVMKSIITDKSKAVTQ